MIVPARRTQHLRFNERIFVLAFEAGDEFVEAIRQFATEQKVNAGWFNGLGAFREATIAYFLLEEKRYEEIPIVEQVEVASLTGNLALKDDAIVVHAHVVLGRRDGAALAGHLVRGVVCPTLELMLIEAQHLLMRKRDPQFELPLLDLHSSR